MDELHNGMRALVRDALRRRKAVAQWFRSGTVRPIPEDESRSRFTELLAERTQLARERGWTESEVERDVTAAVREVRIARTRR